MRKHTPGPWAAVSANAACEVACMEIAEVAHMRVVPEGGGWPTAGTPEDDARLIAAAPDLLEALWKCVAAIERTAHYTEADRFAAADFARAAIAKAEGK